MQLAINILEETPSALRLAAQFLLDHANLREAMDAGAGMPAPAAMPLTPQPPAFDPPPPLAAHAAPPPPVVHVDAPPPPPPANNVLPFPAPPAPPAPTVTAPATSTASPTSAPASAATFDKSGVPYDGRIHQKGRAQKKDGTWKIQKGLDPNIVEGVMRELSQRVNVAEGVRQWQLAQTGESVPTAPAAPPAPNTPTTAGATAPVSLPPPPPPVNAQAPAHVPPPPASVAEAPQGQTLDQTPGASGPGADPFRALITKITQARNAGKLTAEEVTAAWTQAGAPSLQLLNAMPHLIPATETYIDACIASR